MSLGELQRAVQESNVGTLAELLNRAATTVLPHQHQELEEAAFTLHTPLQQLHSRLLQLQHLLIKSGPSHNSQQQEVGGQANQNSDLHQQQQQGGQGSVYGNHQVQRGGRAQQQKKGRGHQSSGKNQQQQQQEVVDVCMAAPGEALTAWEVKELLVKGLISDTAWKVYRREAFAVAPPQAAGTAAGTRAAASSAAGGSAGRVAAASRTAAAAARGGGGKGASSSAGGGGGSCEGTEGGLAALHGDVPSPLLLQYAALGDEQGKPWCEGLLSPGGGSGVNGVAGTAAVSVHDPEPVAKVLEAIDKALKAAIDAGEEKAASRVRDRAKQLECRRGGINGEMRRLLEQDCSNLCKLLKQEGGDAWRSSSSRSTGSMLAPLVLDVAVDPQVAEAMLQLQSLVLQLLQQKVWGQWKQVCGMYEAALRQYGLQKERWEEICAVGDVVVSYCCCGVVAAGWRHGWRREGGMVLGQLQLAIAKAICEAVLGVLSSEKSLSAGTLVETVLDHLAQELPLLQLQRPAQALSQQQQEGVQKKYSFLLQQLLIAARTIFLSKGVFRAGPKGMQLFQACTIHRKQAPYLGEALRGDLHLALLSAKNAGGGEGERAAGDGVGDLQNDDLLRDVLAYFDVDTLNCIQDAQEERQRLQAATAAAGAGASSSSSSSRGQRLQEVLALHAQLTPMLQLYGSIRVVVGDYTLPPYHAAAVRLKQLAQWKWPSAAAGEEEQQQQWLGLKGAPPLLLLLQRLSRACQGHPAALAALAATGGRRNLERLFMELLVPVVLDPKTAHDDTAAADGGVGVQDGGEGDGCDNDVLMMDDIDDEKWRWQKQVPLLQGLLQKEVVHALGLEAHGRRYQAAITGEAIPGWDGVWSAFKLAQLPNLWAEVRPLDVLALFCTAVRCRIAVYVQLPSAAKLRQQLKGEQQQGRRRKRGGDTSSKDQGEPGGRVGTRSGTTGRVMQQQQQQQQLPTGQRRKGGEQHAQQQQGDAIAVEAEGVASAPGQSSLGT